MFVGVIMCFYWSISAFNTPKSHIDKLYLSLDIDQNRLNYYYAEYGSFELAELAKLL